MKTTAKFGAAKRLRFADKKRIMSPEMSPKSFGTFERQAPGLQKNLKDKFSKRDIAVGYIRS